MKRVVTVLMLVFMMCFALTGCVNEYATDYDISINADGSASYTIKMSFASNTIECKDLSTLFEVFDIENEPITPEMKNYRSALANVDSKTVYEGGNTYLLTEIKVKSYSDLASNIAKMKEVGNDYYESAIRIEGRAYNMSEEQLIDTVKNSTDFGTYTITVPGSIEVSGDTQHVVKNSGNSVSVTICPESSSQVITIKGLISSGSIAQSLTIPVKEPVKTRTYNNQFTDVPDDAWYKQDLITAYECGLFNGTSDTTFNPNGHLGVEEAVVVAARIHSVMAGDNYNFTANPGEPWYQPYFDYAGAKGIVEQAVINHFAGDVVYTDANGYVDYRDITRCNMAYVFAHALSDNWYEVVNENPVMSIKFGEAGEEFARYFFPYEMCADEVETLYKAGILAGSDAEGTMYANKYITRAEAVTIVARLIDVDSRK